MANDLSLEITGNSGKAVNALDKIIQKLSEYQSKLIQIIPRMNQFNNILKNIPSGAGNRYKELANGINSIANALKKFDNKTPLNSLKSELEMIKRSSAGLDAVTKKLTDVSNAMNTTGSASKLSAELAKYQAQIDISNARTQSAMAKSAYDTENYALKTAKLTEAKEKLAEIERKAAESAKWDEEARKSASEAVEREIKRLKDHQAEMELLNKRIENERKFYTPPVKSDAQIAQEATLRSVVANKSMPQFYVDDEKVKTAIESVKSYIESLNPAIENMSATAQNRFDSLAKKLLEITPELEKQKHIYENFAKDIERITNTFGDKAPKILKDYSFDTDLKEEAARLRELMQESDKLKRAMEKLATPTKNASNAIEKAGKSSEKASKGFSSFDRVIRNLKTYFLVGAINKISQAFSGALSNAMNFTENMNLFNVSMGENVYKAGEFIDKMSSVFGMDSSNLVKTMGNFYQISHSMGVTSKNAYTLSENFTKLANDLSSFYNISVNDATVKLQAGLVGETEPLRRLGIIITENALKQTAANLGIQKSVRDMSEAEKMHLRYITVLEQTKNVQGDFARTINEPAQYIKILQEQLSQLSRTIGSVFMPVLGAVLPYIIAFSKALTTLMSGLAALFGYKKPEYQDLGSGFSSAVDEADNLGNSIGNATSKAKEFKKLIMGFDELNILTEPKDTSGGSAGSGAGSGDFAVPDLTGYDNLMDSINTRMDEIYQNIMSFFENVGKLLEPTNQAFARLGEELDRLGKFAWQGLIDFYNLFLVPVGNWVFGEGLPRFIDAITFGLATIDYSKINNALNGLWQALTPFALSIGDGLLWFWENVLVPLGTWTMNNAVPTFLNLLTGAITFLTPIIEGFKTAFDWLWNSFLKPIAEWTGGVICSVLNEISNVLSDIGTWMSENKVIVEDISIVIGAFATAWGLVNLAIGIWNIIGVIATTVTTAFGAAVAFLTSPIGLVILAIAAIIVIIVLLIKHWDDIKNAAINCWDWIVDTWNKAWKWFDENVITPIKNLFSGLWEGIQNIFSTVSNWFGNVFTKAYEAVTNAFSKVKSFFSDIWDNIKNMFTNIGTTIGNAIGGAFKTVVNSIINFAQNTINGFIRAINTAISLINLIPGVNINKISELNIPKLAKGGLVTESIVANIGEGKDQEAVIPLNNEVFSKLAEGINKNSTENNSVFSEESLYKAFLRALQNAPDKTATFVATLNNKIIAKEVLKEQQTQNRRFSPVSL